MIILNPLKPFYIDKINKTVRMGNFKDTGSEIQYEDESFLTIFKYVKSAISKEELINKIIKETQCSKDDVINAVDYLISENFIIEEEKYKQILLEKKYSRQNLFFSMSNNSFTNYDEIIKNKNILILGLGGIGSNVAFMLNRAGCNSFTFVDYDKVDESNLIRQFPYDESQLNMFKTAALKSKMNKNTKILKREKEILCRDDIVNDIANADLVLCTLDKPNRVIRRIVNAVCVELNKPVIFSGFSEHVAMVGPFVIPHKTACLMCLEKNIEELPLENVDIVPSYGPLCMIISSIVVNEIINFFTKYNKFNLTGKTLMFNILNYESEIINWNQKSNCEVCGINDGDK